MNETKTFNRVTINGKPVTDINSVATTTVAGNGNGGGAYGYYIKDGNTAVYGNEYGGAYVTTEQHRKVRINGVPAIYAVTFTAQPAGATYYVYATNQNALLTAIDALSISG